MRRTTVLGFAFTATLTVLTAGCSDSGGSSTPTTSSSATSTTTFDARTDADNEEQAVIDAYLAGLDSYYEAANPPDPEHPDLLATHTGGLLEAVQGLLEDLAERGSAIRRSDQSANHPQVIELNPGQAIIEDCAFDADVEFRTSTDEVLDDVQVYVRYLVRMELAHGRWLTAAIEAENLEEPCAPAP